MTSVSEEFGYILVALKKKIMLIVGIIFIGMLVSYSFLVDPVLLRIKEDLLPEGASLIYISPVEVIMLKLKIAMLTGIILATPVVCYYVYKTLKERFEIRNPMKKTHLIILLASAISLFIAGIGYAYFLMLPLVLTYLCYMSSTVGVAATYSIHEFITFVVIIALILGISFELPVVLVFVVHSGLVQIDTLKEYRRYIYVAMFVLAAVFTPPDVVSQLIVAFPLIICYEIGIVVASFISKRHFLTHRASE
ncbi:Sec-independent protein translocase protein TatC [ANME-1 cluster archaeon GoMg2]|jgi:sec-independent protein translocase protein TatC|nr:Sec-independent protein translocase protein TatC [ANME-1 cluster archaeon GoMg2]